MRLDLRHNFADASHDIKRVRSRKSPDANECRGLAVEADILLVIFCAQHDISDFTKPHDDTILLLDDQLTELLRRSQIRVSHQIDRHHGSLGSTQGRQIVVSRQGFSKLGRRNAERGHLLGLQPNPHCECAFAENIGSLNSTDRAELGLHDAGQVIRNLILVEVRR